MLNSFSPSPIPYRQNVVFRSFVATFTSGPSGHAVAKIIRSDSLAHARLIAQDMAELDGTQVVDVIPCDNEKVNTSE